MAIDSWYGSFDILFPGATINCDTPEKERALLDYIYGRTDSPLMDIYQFKSIDSVFSALFFNTTYIHESRHVHDYLVNPVLNCVYRHKLTSLFYSFQLMVRAESLNSACYNILPLPFNKWLQLSEDQRLEYINDWSDNLFHANAPGTYLPTVNHFEDIIKLNPEIENDPVTHGLVLAASEYQYASKIPKLRVGDQYNRIISTKSLLEASAVICQLHHALALYGGSAMDLMWHLIGEKIREEAKPTRVFTDYTVVFSYIDLYLRRQGIIDRCYSLIFASYLINWCFRGNIFEKDAIISPPARLREFIENDFARGMTIEQITNDTISVFEYWEKLLGCKALNYDAAMSDCLGYYDKLIDECSNLGFRQIAEYTSMIKKASVRMSNVYNDDAAFYLYPDLYVKYFRNFTNVPVRYLIKADFSQEDLKRIKGVFTYVREPENNRAEDGSLSIQDLTIDNPVIQLSKDEKPSSSFQNQLNCKTSFELRQFLGISESLFKDEPEYGADDINQLFGGLSVRYVF